MSDQNKKFDDSFDELKDALAPPEFASASDAAVGVAKIEALGAIPTTFAGETQSGPAIILPQESESAENSGLENLNSDEHLEDELPKNKFLVAQKILRRVTDELNTLAKLLGEKDADDLPVESFASTRDERQIKPQEGARVVEGVFDGQNMIGSDGNQYTVPPNYASKSKLVEGDILKLTISRGGSFTFKQIGPIERARIVGSLVEDYEEGKYRVLANDKSWHVLTASVTYYKGEEGDEVIILIPKNAPSKWAAVENIVKK